MDVFLVSTHSVCIPILEPFHRQLFWIESQSVVITLSKRFSSSWRTVFSGVKNVALFLNLQEYWSTWTSSFFALCATPTKVWNSSLAWVKLWQKFEEEATDKKEVEVSLFPCPFVGSDTSLSFDIFFWVVFDSRDTWKAKTINKSSKSLHFYSLEFANPLSFILGRN